MPKTRVVFYKDDDGSVPLLVWLEEVEPQETVAKCIALIDLLKEHGHALRRPHADILKDGIYELRARLKKLRLRILYFFAGKTAVLTHGFIKPASKVSPEEIKRAKGFRKRYHEDPEEHTYEEDE